MDDIQTILYIVIAVLYVIFRVFLKKKPKPQPPPVEQEHHQDVESPAKEKRDSPSPMSFEDVFKELSGQKKAPKQEPQAPQFEDENIKSAYEESIQRAKEIKKPKNQAIPAIHPKFESFEDYETEDKGNWLADEIRASLKDPGDLKRAIVLKEILKRRF